jgi:hypothetical protein
MAKPQTQIATQMSLGIVAASLDESGKFLALDFAGPDGPEAQLRVVLPAESVRMLASQLNQLVAALDDPESGVQAQKSH